jgi:hypothetical protein
MIALHSWSTNLVNEISLAKNTKQYSIAFTNYSKFDERSNWTFEYISKITTKVSQVTFCPDSVALTIDDICHGIRQVERHALPSGNILIDATSLALPEILNLFELLKLKKRRFDVLYVQPTEYNSTGVSSLDTVKSYDLSDDGIGIEQVHPNVGYSDSSHIVFFLGWEGHRFGGLINSDEYNTSNLTCVIGTPPFKFGWENITLSNNYKQIEEINCNPSARFKFAGANDPVKTYEVIDQIYQSAKYEQQNLCLAPLGTKPAAIAAAQFAVNHSNVVVIYDYVEKKNKRSSGTDLLHLWEFIYI